MTLIDYEYELRADDEIVSTGRFLSEQAHDVGDKLVIAGRDVVVVAVTPGFRGSRPRLFVERR
jgi:hypothetical protein